jgi:hypothetical protein
LRKADQARAINVDAIEALVFSAAKGALSIEDCNIIVAVIRLFHHLLGPLFRTSEKRADILSKSEDENTGQGEDTGQGQSDEKGPKPPPRPGHGRNGVKKLTGARRVEIPHPTLSPCTVCPACVMGKIYDSPPVVFPWFTAQPPVQATVFELERLRCNRCQELFVAPRPEGFPDKKYDETVPALLGLLKYGAGMTLYRIDKIQKAVGVPLSESTQWGLLKEAADKLEPIHEAMIDAAAQGQQFYNDDTSMKVIKMVRPEGDTRTGVRTSGIVSVLETNETISLYFTGRQLAGESLRDILLRRSAGLEAPRQMCDGLDHNVPKLPPEYRVLLSNCLVHGRRYFVNVLENFPTECRHVLDELAKVFRYDAEARELGMTAQQRLRHHQVCSGKVMGHLKKWMKAQLTECKTEPNSGLGKAIRYFLKHWKRLTMFLRVAGAAIDNNICERALKKVVLHRKNALFYRTLIGARVGDIFMSLIHTCQLNGVDPFDYLTVLLRREAAVRQDPGNWMPWNYRRMLDRAGPSRTESPMDQAA